MNCFRTIISLAALAVVLISSGSTQELARRVQFARGESSAVLEGSVARGERAYFVLHARAGQQLQLHIVSREDNAVFAVLQPGRKQWLPGAGEADAAKRWSGTLPVSGDYLIIVGGTRGNTRYKLTVATQ